MRKILSVFISMFIILSISSCTDQGRNSNTPLVIYMMDGNVNIQNAIDKFNKVHKSTPIKTEKFFQDQRTELSERLQYELASGEGPDVILLEQDTLPELSKYMEYGAFYNIDDLMKKDKKFDIQEYNNIVLNYGIYKEKRYVIPLFYTVDAFFTTNEILKDNKIDISSPFIGMEKIADIASDYMKQGKPGTFFSPLDFSYFMNQYKGLPDIENKKANLCTEELKKLLETYKLLYDASDKGKAFDKYKEGGDSDLLKNRNTILNLNEINCLKMLWAHYYSFEEEITPEIRMITTDGKEHATARPVMSVAVNSNCANKKAACEFVKLLLSEEFQENASTYYLPVNLKAYNIQRDIFLKGQGEKDYLIELRKGGLKTDSSARKAISDIDKIIAAIDNCSLQDYVIYSMIAEKAKEYLDGKNSTEDIAKSIQETVQKYMDKKLVKPQKKIVTEEVEEPKIKLKFFLPTYYDFAKNALRVYKDKYKNVETVVEEADDIRTRLTTDMMSGNGPDVVLFESYTFDSLYKIISAGAFSSLDELVANDKTFNPSDYFEYVLEAGVIEGKRYYIPLSFSPKFLYTTAKSLESKAVLYDQSNWTWSGFADQAKTFMKNRKNKDQYFYGYYASIVNLLMNCNVSFIHYQDKKTSFATKEFLDMLKTYKDLYLSTVPENITMQETESNQYLKSCMLARITLADIQDWFGICAIYSDIMKYKNEKLAVVPMPSNTLGKVKSYVSPSFSAAISSSCKNKQVAFEYIKVLLSKDIQTHFDSKNTPNFPTSMPVNKSAYEEEKLIYSCEKAAKSYPDSFKAYPLPSEIVDMIDNIVKNGELSPYYDNNAMTIIGEEADAFAQGKKTAEEAAAEIDRKVMLILNE